MDRKSIIVLVVTFTLLMLWYPLVVNKFYPPKPVPVATNVPPPTVTATNQTASSTPPTLEALPPTRSPLANTNEPEQLLDLTNANARYVFTSYGGGLKQMELLHYPESTSTRRKKQPLTHRVATLNTLAPVPALALLGGEAIQGDGLFKLKRLPNGVRAEKTLTNGLTIVKEFELSSNYLVAATVRFENHSTKPLNLPAQDWVVGTATPLGPDDDGTAVGVLWYNGAKSASVGASYFSSRGFACVPRVPPAQYRAGESNVLWVAVHNRFFTLAAMPQQPAQAVVVQKVRLPHPSADDATSTAASAPPPEGYEAAMVYPAETVAPGQSVERKLFLFGGPKEYQTLARIGDTFKNNLDVVMNFGWSGFVSKALLLGMNWLHNILRLPYGWAIVAITVIIKLVFWPLTQASTRSMKRMQALQPQVKAIQEKYKDDPVKSQRKMMELWKEHKVSPMSGCLPMLIQIPVFFGFYQMIQSAIELRGAGWLWVGDLAKPDTLFDIPGTAFHFNLLPLIMGATMLWQARLTPPSPGMDPTQAKMMRYMPLMFMVFLYNFSAGLTLYWTVQNLLTIAQTKLTRTTDATPAAPSQAKGPVLTPGPKKRK